MTGEKNDYSVVHLCHCMPQKFIQCYCHVSASEKNFHSIKQIVTQITKSGHHPAFLMNLYSLCKSDPLLNIKFYKSSSFQKTISKITQYVPSATIFLLAAHLCLRWTIQNVYIKIQFVAPGCCHSISGCCHAIL